MLNGRKLLLADDSAAIQKVIDLTFSDEGMQVSTVGDGRSALAELEQFPPPDVVLADVFMPEVGGFELCRRIKQNERFARIPVILLVSSFEPFDEAEARRAGADDIVSKPFQSIRELVSRVGSLLGGGAKTDKFSTLGLTQTEARAEEPASDQSVTVMVEAPTMNTQESSEPAEATCVADVELQTADTKKLERKVDEPVEDESHLQDTIEVEAVDYSVSSEAKTVEPEEPQYSQFAETTEINMESMPSEAAKTPDDALLDLDETIGEEIVANDVYLDLEFEEAVPAKVTKTTTQVAPEREAIPAGVFTAEAVTSEQTAASAEEGASSVQGSTPAADLSPEAIDAIARRVVEQMSEKAVREIAWEVVPDLAELMIKKKLEDQK